MIGFNWQMSKYLSLGFSNYANTRDWILRVGIEESCAEGGKQHQRGKLRLYCFLCQFHNFSQSCLCSWLYDVDIGERIGKGVCVSMYCVCQRLPRATECHLAITGSLNKAQMTHREIFYFGITGTLIRNYWMLLNFKKLAFFRNFKLFCMTMVGLE